MKFLQNVFWFMILAASSLHFGLQANVQAQEVSDGRKSALTPSQIKAELRDYHNERSDLLDSIDEDGSRDRLAKVNDHIAYLHQLEKMNKKSLEKSGDTPVPVPHSKDKDLISENLSKESQLRDAKTSLASRLKVDQESGNPARTELDRATLKKIDSLLLKVTGKPIGPLSSEDEIEFSQLDLDRIREFNSGQSTERTQHLQSAQQVRERPDDPAANRPRKPAVMDSSQASDALRGNH